MKKCILIALGALIATSPMTFGETPSECELTQLKAQRDKAVATASADLSVKVWNLETGRRLEEFRSMVIPPNAPAFSPSGQRLGCASQDGYTRIWEPESLK